MRKNITDMGYKEAYNKLFEICFCDELSENLYDALDYLDIVKKTLNDYDKLQQDYDKLQQKYEEVCKKLEEK